MPEEQKQMNEAGLKLLTQMLAINHYNISVATDNYDQTKVIPPGLEDIFLDKAIRNQEVNLGFPRNIVIVGAGASKNTYDFIKIAKESIKQLHEKLGVKKLLGIGKEDKPTFLLNKYIQLASTFSNEIIEEYTDGKSPQDIFDEINNTLSFENNLRLLLHFFKKEDVIVELNRTIAYSELNVEGTRYLPSLTYEVIAHLFKHRYIDIIINLNFDELLDNAIEDEMGNTTYHHIIHDTGCTSLKEIVDDKRLRIPIYIKPHGTAQSRSSMRFTNEQYVEVSYDMKNLLKDIFDGKVGSDSESIQRFNIILVGYGIKDIDIRKILFRHLKKHLKNPVGASSVNYFVFDTSAKKVVSSFKRNFRQWYISEALIEQGRYIEDIESDEYSLPKDEINNQFPELIRIDENSPKPTNINFHQFDCESSYDKEEMHDEYSLGSYFYILHKGLSEIFHDRFKPKDLLRQKILLDLFPRTEIEHKSINGDRYDFADFLKYRARFYALYELIKNKGRISINTLIKGRIAKYQSKYLEEAHRKDGSALDDESTIISFLRNKLGVNNIKTDNRYITYQPFFMKEKNEDEIIIIANEMLKNTFLCDESKAKKISDLIVDLKEITKEKNIYHINTVYNAPEYWRFFPFKQERYFTTNLGLSWKLYNHINNFSNQWDELWLITNTGRVLSRINSYEKSIEDLFCNPESPKNVKLIYTIDTSSAPHYIKDIFKNAGCEERCEIRTASERDDYIDHRLALFLKHQTGNLIPQVGIYFIKNIGQMEINPIWFENIGRDESAADIKNLKIIYDIFSEIAAQKDLLIKPLTDEFIENTVLKK